MKFEIKHRHTGAVLFECEAGSLKIAVEMAISKDAKLRDANLRDAYLEGANLEGANLGGVYLEGAYLRDANLEGANLGCVYLEYANLRGAYLVDASLRSASLTSANLEDANLKGANLKDAYLVGANLREANLRDVKQDLFTKLTNVKGEVIGLYKTLHEGRINGFCYEGECSCFCGTISNLKGLEWNGEEFEKLTNIEPDSDSPIEKWFLAIKQGDTPQNNPISKITSEWLEEFMEKNLIKIPKMKTVWE